MINNQSNNSSNSSNGSKFIDINLISIYDANIINEII